MSLHRKWSKKVQVPVGTEWGTPYTTSVAECMVWKAPTNQPGSYHDTLGKPRSAVRPPSPPDYRRPIERCEPDGTYYHGNDRVAATRNTTHLYPRAPTPAAAITSGRAPVTGRVPNGTNYADGFTSYYVDSRPEGQSYSLSRQYTGRDLMDTDRSVAAKLRARSVGPCESYRELERSEMERNDDADLIASFLDSRDAVTYEQAKRDLYDHTYKQQLEDERHRLYAQRQREYDSHVRAHTGQSTIDDRTLQDALKSHARSTSTHARTQDYTRARPPPVPRPPAGMKSEHKASFTDPRVRKVGYASPTNGYVENLRVTTTADGDAAIKNLHRAALSRSLLHAPDYRDLPPTPPTTKPVKRVNFRPQSASALHNHSRKGNHFFEWRDATEPSRDQLWKMSKYEHVKPRIDTRWTNDPYSVRGKKEEPGKVHVNLECPEGEEMNVSMRIESSPSRNGYYMV